MRLVHRKNRRLDAHVAHDVCHLIAGARGHGVVHCGNGQIAQPAPGVHDRGCRSAMCRDHGREHAGIWHTREPAHVAHDVDPRMTVARGHGSIGDWMYDGRSERGFCNFTTLHPKVCWNRESAVACWILWRTNLVMFAGLGLGTIDGPLPVRLALLIGGKIQCPVAETGRWATFKEG